MSRSNTLAAKSARRVAKATRKYDANVRQTKYPIVKAGAVVGFSTAVVSLPLIDRKDKLGNLVSRHTSPIRYEKISA